MLESHNRSQRFKLYLAEDCLVDFPCWLQNEFITTGSMYFFQGSQPNGRTGNRLFPFKRIRGSDQNLHPYMAMGQNPVPPANIPSPTKIGPKMGGAPTPKWDLGGFDPQPYGREQSRGIPLASRRIRPRLRRRPGRSRRWTVAAAPGRSGAPSPPRAAAIPSCRIVWYLVRVHALTS